MTVAVKAGQQRAMVLSDGDTGSTRAVEQSSIRLLASGDKQPWAKAIASACLWSREARCNCLSGRTV
jgi:hypothetical protein